MRRYLRRAPVHRDANHGDIVRALEAAGRSVLDLSAVGKGAPDLLVGWSGHMVLMEVKNPEGRDHGSCALLPDQERWHATWKGTRVVVVRNVEEALEATGVRVRLRGAA